MSDERNRGKKTIVVLHKKPVLQVGHSRTRFEPNKGTYLLFAFLLLLRN